MVHFQQCPSNEIKALLLLRFFHCRMSRCDGIHEQHDGNKTAPNCATTIVSPPAVFFRTRTQQTTYKKICEYLAPGDKLQFTCTDAGIFQFHKIHWFSHNRPTFQQGGNQNQELKNLSVLYNFTGPLNTTNKYAFFPGLICVLSLVHIGKPQKKNTTFCFLRFCFLFASHLRTLFLATFNLPR